MSGGPTEHVSVLLSEVVQWMEPQPGRIFVDGTLGGGGHARALAERVRPNGLVIGLDRDPQAIARAEKSLAGLPVALAQANFTDIPEVLEELDVKLIDGLVLDLGMSSDQLADGTRGFSFRSTGPLDLRFDPERGESAARLINRLDEKQLADVIYRYGEERHSRRIARAIVERRKTAPIETAEALADVVRSCVPFPKGGHRIDPATRTFQAIRIAVNDELKSLETVLKRAPEFLRPGGRIAVISFHSLEDRLVKEAFRDDPRYAVLTRKPITAGEAETAANPRARSAKLRVAGRTTDPA